jgi:hypothetical protein
MNLQCSEIPEGTTLWNVFAWDAPFELGGQEYLVGRIVTTSEFTTSMWGDKHLFFRHEFPNFDLERRPEWIPFTPGHASVISDDLLGFQATGTASRLASGCPFANLWQDN